ncbi:hypothetical protein [Paenibacillus glucanolyticus]|uniref:hypothetical protein n=1 Tax=Paenibacillus glucanolyticus TaxID=59843 RepID=UPI00096E3F36|nr:hypothetical protein [Paenibacillus glucanolyticus]OMF76771.1 hypothetical protein BK142_14730 [Paenibacillus glucanolyticus]
MRLKFLGRTAGRVVLLGVMALLLALSIIIPISNVFAANDGVSDLSLYQRGSELTREFGTALAPGSEVRHMYMLEDNDSTNLLPAGNAGGLLGYAEILSDDTGIKGWLMSAFTTASATITYDQLMNVVDNGGDTVYHAGLNNPFFQYAGYGDVLTEMGLITTVRPGISSIGRMLASGIMLLVYLLANAAPFLFRAALMLLSALNPFKLFETAINGTASADLGMLSGAAEYVGSIYSTVQDFSIYILFPLLLVLTVFSVLVFNQKGSFMKKFGRYGVRVFMLFAGLPLIGATYTGVIKDLNNKVAVGSEYADYLVLSSYVDFENWVKYSRLAPPEESEIHNPRYEEDERRTLSNRKLILEINGTRAANTRAEELKNRYSGTSNISEIFNEGGGRTDVDAPGSTVPGMPPGTPGSPAPGDVNRGSFSKVFSVLSRHMTSTLYSGSDYDGEVAGQIQKIRASNPSETNDQEIAHMYSLSASDSRTWSSKLSSWSNDPDWMRPIHWNGEDNKVGSSAKGLFTEGAALNPLFQFGIYSYNIYNAGNLQYSATKGYHVPDMPPIVTQKVAPIGSDKTGTIGGLSPIAMYNFLNTTFSNTGLTVYSPSKTASDLSRDSYASVAFGGSGMSSFTRWIENITVMLSLAILSIMYGFAMISIAIKSIPRILSGVFGTALGSIAFITKLLISTAVLIAQIIGMIFFYALSENLIMTVLLNFNDLIDSGGNYFGSGVIFDFVGSFLTIAITAGITIFMIRNKTVFNEMMEEVVSGAINRLMGALDTGTGGKGLDLGKMTDGRVGGDGRLTQDAKVADRGGLLGGAAGLLSAAHGIESRREQLGEELGKDGGSIKDKIKARMDTAKDLASAKGKDIAKGALGIEGQSLARELAAKEAGINALPYSQLSQDEFDDARGGITDQLPDTTNSGQRIDENGEIMQNAEGHALDREGNPISAMSPVGAIGARAMVADDGSLIDSQGNTYRDEAGNAFYQNDRGQLVDQNGAFVALGKDGILTPIADVPGGKGKPVSATKEAKKLDSMRFNAGEFAAMKAEQDATHFGMNKDGNVVGKDGELLQHRTGNSMVPVTLDEKGFVTDRNGNRVDAGSIVGAVDGRGFEEVLDQESGKTHLRHKGDAAIKPTASVNGTEAGGAQNLTALAKNSNRANEIAQRANSRVDELKANGASPYAVMQAQRFADKAGKDAKVAQGAFNKAMEISSSMSPATAQAATLAPVSLVTNDHVSSASRHLSEQQSVLQKEVGQLSELQAQGAPAKEISRQQRRIDDQRQVVQKAMSAAQDMKTAQAVGRSYGEVSGARNRVDKASKFFLNAQAAHAQAVAAKAPQEVIAKHEERLNKASKYLSDSLFNRDRVSRAPSGTPAQIDQATARFEQAQMRYKQSQNRVEQLLQSGAPQNEVKAAQREQAQAKRKASQAYAEKLKATSPEGWNNLQSLSVQSTPKVSANKSFTELAAAGINNYGDYSREVTTHAATIRQGQSKLKQAQQRLASLRSEGRSPLQIQHAESEIRGLQSQIKYAQEKMGHLKEHAQGLLKTGDFQPIVASRPIRKDGSSIINQLINLSHTQGLHDGLLHREKAGTITQTERKQLETLGERLQSLRQGLVGAGIREDAIRDQSRIVESTKQMQQSWEAFIQGKSIE